MTTGSCLCGTVSFEVEGPFRWMAHCHCSMCRKHHGALHGTAIGADPKNFRWSSGEDHIVHYRSSESFERPFCDVCGSTVPDASGETVTIPAGTLHGDPGIKPNVHIFVGSKSPLCDINDSLKTFDAYPPGFGTPVPTPSRTVDDNAPVTGSCLCGEVAFAIDETPRNVVNCHCTRCQRTRGTAHATNVFAHQEKLRWLRGADKVRTYKLPEAQLFATSFCSQCGSLLPALFEGIKRYNVPVGSLDTVLPSKPSLHIHVASRAAWFDITDALPQFEEMPPRERIRELMF